jgi:NAD(P)-dependent dehydrogenase (short-subunit alcohol dehydrogenase family)
VRSSPRRYLVTGASSGLGLAIVKRLHADGHAVLGTGARTRAELPADYPDIAYQQADLTGDLAPLVAAAGDIDRLILAAGMGHYRPLAHETAAAVADVLAVNLGAVVQLLHRLQPVLEGNAGRVGLLGSVAARGSAGMPVYSASKGALAGLARSLASEWQGRIALRHFALWPVRTPMHGRAGYDASRIDFMLMDADRVAGFILWALETSRRPSVSVTPATLLAHRLTGGLR